MTVTGPNTIWDTTQRIYVGGDDGGTGGGNGTLTISRWCFCQFGNDWCRAGRRFNWSLSPYRDLEHLFTPKLFQSLMPLVIFYVAYAGDGDCHLV